MPSRCTAYSVYVTLHTRGSKREVIIHNNFDVLQKEESEIMSGTSHQYMERGEKYKLFTNDRSIRRSIPKDR